MIRRRGTNALLDALALAAKARENAAETQPETRAAAMSEPQTIRIADASKFVNAVAELEGKIRLDACSEGCCCQMEVRGTVIQKDRGGLTLRIGTAHDSPCPWLRPEPSEE